VQLLLQRGLDINVTDNCGRTLLVQAARAGYEHAAEFLIQQGLSVHAVDASQLTPLHCAAACSRGAATVRLLLQHGADMHALAEKSVTPLHVAAATSKLQNAEALLAAGADATLSAEQGITPLHLAVQDGHAALVKLFLEHGAAAVLNTMQYTKRNSCGAVSAVMLCSDSATLKLLLTAGADVQAVASSGDTCLHIAARHGYSAPVLCLLIKAGADLHAVNSADKTAAQVAHEKGHTLLEQLLNRAAQD
jgi:ankyrin repeat protein